MTDDDPPLRRILSIDGAGIYGLSAARWLQQMCRSDPKFLHKDSFRWLFAGTSSGAVNALLLARHDNPRDGVDDLVAFWYAAAPWSNRLNPISSLFSWYGLTAWYGTEDFLTFLSSVFGDTKLGDLKHDVLVAGYALDGTTTFQTTRPGLAQVWETLFGKSSAPPARAPGATPGFDSVVAGHNGAPNRHWQPVIATNFLEGSTAGPIPLVDLAYMATSMPSLRAIRGGLADAGMFNANPSLLALAAAVADVVDRLPPGVDYYASVGDVLRGLAMLSIGDGSTQPYYWLSNFDFGSWPWLMLPVDPTRSPFPPSAYALQAPAQEADMVVSTMLGREKYFRLNPGIISLPTAATVYSARVPLIRQVILQMVESGVASPPSTHAVDAAIQFVNSGPWNGL